MACRRLWMAVAVAAPCLVVVGCGDSGAHVTLGASSAPTGSSGSSQASPSGTLSVAGPSVSARMICSEEIANAVTLSLGLNGHPQKTSEWVKPVYTCTYRLLEGPLRLSVTEFGSDEAALQEFNRMRSQYVHDKAPIQTLDAFGVPAFLASDDVVLTVKDNKLLRVDATRLSKTVGPDHRTRRDLSYIVASSILRCWSGG